MNEREVAKILGEIYNQYFNSKDRHVFSSIANLENELGLDSLDVIEYIMEIESQMNITFPDEIAEKFRTVQDIINYILEVKK